MTSANIRTLVNEIISLKSQVNSMGTPQLKFSSIEQAGNITIREPAFDEYGQPAVNEDGIQVFRETIQMGMQFDGSYAAEPLTSGQFPPPTASDPILVPVPGGIVIKWDGMFTDSLFAPMNFSRVEMHLSDDITFDYRMSDTIVGTAESPRAGYAVVQGLTPGLTYYSRLIVRDKAGAFGPPSVQVSATPDEFTSDAETLAAIERAVSDIDQKATTAVLTASEAKGEAQAAQDTASAAQTTAEGALAAAEAARKANEEAAKDMQDAAKAAMDADALATRALASADGKNRVTYSTDRPEGEEVTDGDGTLLGIDPSETSGLTVGDTWYKRSDDGLMLEEVWEFDGSAWERRKFTSQTIDTITAAQITTGTLRAGQQIITGDEKTFTALGGSSLVVNRTYDEDLGPQPTVSIGGIEEDVIQLVDPETNRLSGFDATGRMNMTEINTDKISIGGTTIGTLDSVEDMLWRFPRGYVAGFRPRENSPSFGPNQLGICEMAAPLDRRRLYRLKWTGNFVSSDRAGTVRLFLRFKADDGTPVTIANTTQLTMGMFTVADGSTRLEIESYIFGPAFDGQVFRFLLTAQKLLSGTGYYHSDGGLTPGLLYLEDMGSAVMEGGVYSSGSQTSAGGVPASGAAQVGSSVANTGRVLTYNSTWSKTWRGSSALSSGEIRSGNSNGQLRSAIGFSSSIQSDVAGSTISRIEVYLYANHWYNHSGGEALIGLHGAPSPTAAWPNGLGVTHRDRWNTKSGGKWITLPSAWHSRFLDGTAKGITYGDGSTSANVHYSRVNGYGQNYRPQLRITLAR